MKNFLPLTFALALAACTAEAPKPVDASSGDPAEKAAEPAEKAAETTEETTEAQPVTIEASVHNVKCGCAIETIPKCGNYVEFDGEYSQIINSKEMGLGVMEWCQRDGIKAKIAGTRNGISFTATSIEIVL